MLYWLLGFTGWLLMKATNKWLDVYEFSTLLGFILLPFNAVLSIVLMILVFVLVMTFYIALLIVGGEIRECEMYDKFIKEYEKLIGRY